MAGALTFARTGDALNVVSREGQVYRTTLTAPPVVTTLLREPSKARVIAVSPVGDWFALGGADGRVTTHALDGAMTAAWNAHASAIFDVTIDPQGERLATASRDGLVKVWSRDGSLLTTFEGHGDSVLCVAFSPSGKGLASGARDNTARVWWFEGFPTQVLTGHQRKVNSVVWVGDDALRTGSDDHQVRTWDLNRGTLAPGGVENLAEPVAALGVLPTRATLALGERGSFVRLGPPHARVTTLVEQLRALPDGGMRLVTDARRLLEGRTLGREHDVPEQSTTVWWATG